MVAVAHAGGAELQQLSSFYRLLNQASHSRSEREIMRVFVEALAVWHDAESWAYRADVTGRFVLDVTLPGSDRGQVPSIIDAARLTSDFGKPSVLALDDLETLGFHGAPNLLMSRVQVRGSSDWLIATDNPGRPEAEARLGVYVQAVSQTLSEVNAVLASRLTWAILEHLLPVNDSPHFAAAGAVAELASSVDASAWLTVFSKDGAPVLAAGDLMSRLALAAPERMPNELVLPVDLPEGFHGAIGLRRAGGRPLSGRDEHLLRLAANTLSTWLKAHVARLSVEGERRSTGQSFDRVLKQRLDNALAEGETVSVLSVSFGQDAPPLDVVHGCVARIRREIRPADMAGRLSSGEIGVLLPDTAGDEASVVIERLRRALATDSAPATLSVDLVPLPGNEFERAH